MPSSPFSDCSQTSTPSGIWFATSVGRPMPRLTYMPSLSSCAARLAISSRVQGILVAPSSLSSFPRKRESTAERPWVPACAGTTGSGAHGALLDALLGVRVVHDAVDVDARQVHVVRVDVADLHDLLHLGDADLAGHGADRVEVACRLAEHQVAGLVRLPCLDQCDVGDQRGLHDVVLAVELAGFLALRHNGAVAGRGEEGRDAGTAGAQALGQRALRVELQLQLAGQELPLELLVLAHVGGNHLADLPGFQQQAEAEAVDARVVGDGGQAL